MRFTMLSLNTADTFMSYITFQSEKTQSFSEQCKIKTWLS